MSEQFDVVVMRTVVLTSTYAVTAETIVEAAAMGQAILDGTSEHYDPPGANWDHEDQSEFVFSVTAVDREV